MPQTFRELVHLLMIVPLPDHPSHDPDTGPPIINLPSLATDRTAQTEPFVDLVGSTPDEEIVGTRDARVVSTIPTDFRTTTEFVDSGKTPGDASGVASESKSAPDEPDWWFTTSLPIQPPPAEVARAMLPSDSPPDAATTSPPARSFASTDPQLAPPDRGTSAESEAAMDLRSVSSRSDKSSPGSGKRTQPEPDRLETLIDAIEAHLEASQNQQFRTLERLEELFRGALSARDDLVRFAERLDQLETAHSLRGSL